MKSWFVLSLSLLVGTVTLSSCTRVSQTTVAEAQTTSEVRIDGSSTVFPITDAIAQKFRQDNPEAQVNVGISGTGGGFKLFCSGETQINNASRPILAEEMAACRDAQIAYIEIPIAFDALTIVTNPQNTWATDLTVAELKKIWEPTAEGQITNWNQVRADFPNRPLRLYGPGKDSGTYDYFTDVIIGGDLDSRRDYTASESDDVLVRDVETDPNALGYFGFAYFQAAGANLKALAIDGGEGAISPSEATVKNAQYQPLSRPLFIYVNSAAAQQNPILREFVVYYMENVGQTVGQVGYVPLPERAYQIGLGHFYRGKVGSVYEGQPQPNLTIAEVMQKQAQY